MQARYTRCGHKTLLSPGRVGHPHAAEQYRTAGSLTGLSTFLYKSLLNMPLVQTLRLPAKCSPGAHRRLSEVFSMCAEIYNAALES